MSNGIYIVLVMAAILIIILIRFAISMHKTEKLQTALKELHEMPIDEWESKWGEFVQKEYDKCNDPHRQEVEGDMEFFRKELEELNKGDNDENTSKS